jgi:hypothetical protein
VRLLKKLELHTCFAFLISYVVAIPMGVYHTNVSSMLKTSLGEILYR